MIIREPLLRTISILKKDLEREKTKHTGAIFHYTSADGLKNILESKRIWFSNARFLNDASEINYIYTLFPKTPDVYHEDLLDERFFKLISKISNSYITKDYCDIDDRRWWAEDVYIASFSKHKDNLELWNYYTKNQNAIGYNIGFETMPFDFDTDLFRFIHGEVIYDTRKQKEFIKNILLRFNDLYRRYDDVLVENSEEKQMFVINLISILELHNIFFKPRAYSGEEEYRCAIYSINDYQVLKPETRIVNGLLLPFFEIEFEKHLLSTIRISPTGNPMLLKQGVEFFNAMHGYDDVNIYPSNIPKRY